jgi:valyl-tRNA synthetase
VIDEPAEAAVSRMIEAVQALRAWRDLTGVKAGVIVPARLAAACYEDTTEHIERLARLSFESSAPAKPGGFAPGESPNGIDAVDSTESPNGLDAVDATASVPIPGGTVEILASDDVDLGAAQRKLDAKRVKLEAEIERAQRKLANPGFVAKAPANVVQAERDKLAALQAELGLRDSRAGGAGLP